MTITELSNGPTKKEDKRQKSRMECQNPEIIGVRHLSKIFDGNTVLQDINVSIRAGEIISIIGPSGTGKSTFLRCLNLLERPDFGEIVVDGVNILDRKTNIPQLRTKMGMVFQQFNLFPHLTVLENIMLAPRSILKLAPAAAAERAEELLRQVGLAGRGDYLPDELSGGQQQRVAIARTLAMEPKIVLFDEPTSALDPTMVGEVLAVIRNLAKTGMTLLIVTHEMNFARDVSSRVFYMDEGVIYEQGDPIELFDRPKRAKTRAFLRRISTLSLELDSQRFDLLHFKSIVTEFAVRRLLGTQGRDSLLLLLEELLINLLFTVAKNIRVNIGIAEDAVTVEVGAVWTGEPIDPMTSIGPNQAIGVDQLSDPVNLTDSENDSLARAQKVIRNLCQSIDFNVTDDRTCELNLALMLDSE